MNSADSAIQCLVDRELIEEERGGEMQQIAAALPANPVELLQILVALQLTQ